MLIYYLIFLFLFAQRFNCPKSIYCSNPSNPPSLDSVENLQFPTLKVGNKMVAVPTKHISKKENIRGQYFYIYLLKNKFKHKPG